MKRARFIHAFAFLAVASLLAACDATSPTEPLQQLAGDGKSGQTFQVPPDCPAGTPPQFAHGCIPRGPFPPPSEGPSG